VNEDDFDQVVLKSNTPVLVDFWAEWCGPCRTLAPIVEAIAEQYRDAVGVFKLNVDDSCAVAQRLNFSLEMRNPSARRRRSHYPALIALIKALGLIGRERRHSVTRRYLVMTLRHNSAGILPRFLSA
jgi:thiol-disulfide isomerase/thioredoxin